MQLTLNEAQNQLPQLLQSVSEGQEVIIAIFTLVRYKNSSQSLAI